MLKDNQLKKILYICYTVIPHYSNSVQIRFHTRPEHYSASRETCYQMPSPSRVGGKSAKTRQNNVCVCRLDYLHSYPTFLLLSPLLHPSLSLSPLDNYPTNCRRERYGSYRWGKLGRRNVRRAETDRLSATTLAAQTLSFVALTVCSPGSILALPAFPRSLRGSAGIKMPLVESIPEI